jgi:hypothetical protein
MYDQDKVVLCSQLYVGPNKYNATIMIFVVEIRQMKIGPTLLAESDEI